MSPFQWQDVTSPGATTPGGATYPGTTPATPAPRGGLPEIPEGGYSGSLTNPSGYGYTAGGWPTFQSRLFLPPGYTVSAAGILDPKGVVVLAGTFDATNTITSAEVPMLGGQAAYRFDPGSGKWTLGPVSAGSNFATFDPAYKSAYGQPGGPGGPRTRTLANGKVVTIPEREGEQSTGAPPPAYPNRWWEADAATAAAEARAYIISIGNTPELADAWLAEHPDVGKYTAPGSVQGYVDAVIAGGAPPPPPVAPTPAAGGDPAQAQLQEALGATQGQPIATTGTELAPPGGGTPQTPPAEVPVPPANPTREQWTTVPLTAQGGYGPEYGKSSAPASTTPLTEQQMALMNPAAYMQSKGGTATGNADYNNAYAQALTNPEFYGDPTAYATGQARVAQQVQAARQKEQAEIAYYVANPGVEPPARILAQVTTARQKALDEVARKEWEAYDQQVKAITQGGRPNTPDNRTQTEINAAIAAIKKPVVARPAVQPQQNMSMGGYRQPKPATSGTPTMPRTTNPLQTLAQGINKLFKPPAEPTTVPTPTPATGQPPLSDGVPKIGYPSPPPKDRFNWRW